LPGETVRQSTRRHAGTRWLPIPCLDMVAEPADNRCRAIEEEKGSTDAISLIGGFHIESNNY